MSTRTVLYVFSKFTAAVSRVALSLLSVDKVKPDLEPLKQDPRFGLVGLGCQPQALIRQRLIKRDAKMPPVDPDTCTRLLAASSHWLKILPIHRVSVRRCDIFTIRPRYI